MVCVKFRSNRFGSKPHAIALQARHDSAGLLGSHGVGVRLPCDRLSRGSVLKHECQRLGRGLGARRVEHEPANVRHARRLAVGDFLPGELPATVLIIAEGMDLLHHGVDQTVIALWLGHERLETVQIYTHADLWLKEKALARLSAPNSKPGRYRPDDKLLAFLEAL